MKQSYLHSHLKMHHSIFFSVCGRDANALNGSECFEPLQTFSASVLRTEKNAELCDTRENLPQCETNVSRDIGVFFFCIRISLFSTFATLEAGHNADQYQGYHFNYVSFW